ncbi:cupin domain-containing protein [Methanobacterium alcaliphilum]|uniref:cupin domain-containing protein n=1 Tax=Methanobacterium alcaliphilum TaxID=392018 RepID=UPI002009E769|nr:cupin domain-containing protein [Methanobacterium alcaliphilum]MCK9150428.1 cupin domain-containing protein [Methanobacterium alcaliphilum]
MEVKVVNFEEKFSKLEELHSYRIIAQMNDYYFKIVKAKREFIWHTHPETDEVFVVINGELKIDLRDKTMHLKSGDMVVIPQGVEHKPSCPDECHILLIEPTETVNTGDKESELTDTDLEWI